MDPLRASSTYFQLPAWIRNTGCVVNVQNKKTAILAGLYKPTDPHNPPQRVSSYTAHETAGDAPGVKMLTYPVALRDIDKFERENNISVNVYGVDKCRSKKKSFNKEISVERVAGKKRKQSCRKRPS